jgi:hypothetical protein
MSLDSVVDEVREARDAYAKRFNYDLQAICRHLKEHEKKGGGKLVSLPPKRTGQRNQDGNRETGTQLVSTEVKN